MALTYVTQATGGKTTDSDDIKVIKLQSDERVAPPPKKVAYYTFKGIYYVSEDLQLQVKKMSKRKL